MTPPSDRVTLQRRPQGLTAADRRRIVITREQSTEGAVEVSLRAFIRPAGSNRKFSILPSATTTLTAYSGLNAEQIVRGGPLAGKNFAASLAMLELYEQTHREKKNL